MTYQPTRISDTPDTLLHLPGWVTKGVSETVEIVAFRSGAALLTLDRMITDPSRGVPIRLLANRLALSAATATSRIEGRMARETDIRDAFHLTPPGAARGPDGDLLAFWRRAARLRPDRVGDIEGLIGVEAGRDLDAWLRAATGLARTHGPLAGCVSVMRTVLGADDRAERFACLLSDVVLARALNWPCLLPVTAQRLNKAALRDLSTDDDGSGLSVQQRILESVEHTFQLAQGLAGHAAALRSVAPKLRAKGSAAAVDLFLAEDAVAPASMLSPRIR